MPRPRGPLIAVLALVLAACATPAHHGGPSRADVDTTIAAAATIASDPVVDTLVRDARRSANLPALGALVWHDGTTHVAVDGVRRRGAPDSAHARDRWHIGSVAKPMTATLVAREVEAGRLAFDTRLVDIFPELRDGMARGWEEVTVGHLLSHTAGLDDPDDYGAFSWGLRPPFPLNERRYRMLRDAVARPLPRPPGSEYRYSNLGYVYLGALLERVGQAGFESRLAREVFAPLGMNAAAFGQPAAGDAAQPVGHLPAEDGGAPLDPRLEQHLLAPDITPAGDVNMDLASLLAFARLHLDGARGKPRPGYLRSDTLAALYQVPGESNGSGYALGWGVKRDDAGAIELLTHQGSDGFWIADVAILPQENTIVLTVANRYDEATIKALRRALRAEVARRGQED